MGEGTAGVGDDAEDVGHPRGGLAVRQEEQQSNAGLLGRMLKESSSHLQGVVDVGPCRNSGGRR